MKSETRNDVDDMAGESQPIPIVWILSETQIQHVEDFVKKQKNDKK